jgi:hypothetical protein
MKYKILASIAIIISLGCESASAVTVTGSTVGRFTNVNDTTNASVYSINNNDIGDVARFNWGTTDCPACVVPPTPFDNQFTFDGVGSDGGTWVANPDSPFLLGTFTYRNGSTINSIGVAGIDLAADITVLDPVGAAVTDNFAFHITNTPNNSGNPVTDGDIVTVNSGAATLLFSYLNVNYYLEVLGFSKDGGATIASNFSSPEGQTAQAGLYARITATTTAVPEPSSMILLGMGAFGAISARRRRLAKA